MIKILHHLFELFDRNQIGFINLCGLPPRWTDTRYASGMGKHIFLMWKWTTKSANIFIIFYLSKCIFSAIMFMYRWFSGHISLKTNKKNISFVILLHFTIASQSTSNTTKSHCGHYYFFLNIFLTNANDFLSIIFLLLLLIIIIF